MAVSTYIKYKYDTKLLSQQINSTLLLSITCKTYLSEQTLQIMLLFISLCSGCSFFTCLDNPLLWENILGQKEHEKACSTFSAIKNKCPPCYQVCEYNRDHIIYIL